LRLKSYIWADQVDRLERLSAAIAICRRVPATVDPADAVAVLEVLDAARHSASAGTTVRPASAEGTR